MKKYTPKEILKIIAPPEKIKSFEQIKELVNSDKNLTLIQKDFFTHFQKLFLQSIDKQIEGDAVLIGIWKGGGALYLKSLFEQNSIDISWHLIDSFNGFNSNNVNYPEDKKALEIFKNFKIIKYPSKNDVIDLFKLYNLEKNLNVYNCFLEDQQNLPKINKISFLHIDVDFYEPTFLSLQQYYPYVSKNGIIVIDDYNVKYYNCKNAVDDFIKINKLNLELINLGDYPIAWQKK
ncbi:MAG TPA: TylF/MycF/NovP-related O-methyltransferase [Bacteroidales bacterium]|nr:TylF/MycF/NovP-related O-methyltransferase [Bacteroidales bacterium]